MMCNIFRFASFDPNAAGERYDLFVVETAKPHWDAAVSDRLTRIKAETGFPLLGCLFNIDGSQRQTLAVFKAGSVTARKLAGALRAAGIDVKVVPTDWATLMRDSPRTVLRALLTIQQNALSERNRFDNVAGCLLKLVRLQAPAGWRHRGKAEDTEAVCLLIDVGDQMNITCKVVTLTRLDVLLDCAGDAGRKKIMRAKRFRLDGGRLVRTFDDHSTSGAPIYAWRKLRGAGKNALDFSAWEEKDYSNTKMSYLEDALDAFNSQFGDFATLEQADLGPTMRGKSTMGRDTFRKRMRNHGIEISVTGSTSNPLFDEKVRVWLRDYPGVEAAYAAQTDLLLPNLVLIDDADSFANNRKDDPHQVSPAVAMQHITPSSVSHGPKITRKDERVLEVALLNLKIKDEIIRGRIGLQGLFDWRALGLGNDLTIVKPRPDNDEKTREKILGRFSMMTVGPEGAILEFEDLDMSGLAAKRPELVNLLFARSLGGDPLVNAECIISSGKDFTAVIGPTGLITMPDRRFAHLRHEKKTANTRKAARLDKTDRDLIKLGYTINESSRCAYYFAGDLNPQKMIARACPIRKVEVPEGDVNRVMDVVFKSLNVLFCKYCQLPALPFFMKYLHEMELMNAIEDDAPDNEIEQASGLKR